MKEVLWLASWYPNETSPFNGDFIQRHARALALIQPVHVVHVVKQPENWGGAALRIDEKMSHRVRETIIYYKAPRTGWSKVDRLLSWWTYNRVYRRYLQADFRKNGLPALVHVHVVMLAGMTARWLKKKYGFPYVVTEQWTGYYRYAGENYFNQNVLFRQYTLETLKHASLLLPVSRDLGETISREIYPVPFKVVPNVADISLFHFAGHKEAGPFRFIHVSSMSEQKNIPGLLRSLQMLQRSTAQWECLMVGPAGSELKAYADSLGLSPHIHWPGELSYEEVARELRKASALLLFSRYETFSCVLVEAACCGVPVIAPSIGPLPEIVDGNNGILVEPDDEAGMAAAMAEMIKGYEKFDRKKISEKAMGLFNYDRVGKMMKEIYQSLL